MQRATYYYTLKISRAAFLVKTMSLYGNLIFMTIIVNFKFKQAFIITEIKKIYYGYTSNVIAGTWIMTSGLKTPALHTSTSMWIFTSAASSQQDIKILLILKYYLSKYYLFWTSIEFYVYVVFLMVFISFYTLSLLPSVICKSECCTALYRRYIFSVSIHLMIGLFSAFKCFNIITRSSYSVHTLSDGLR